MALPSKSQAINRLKFYVAAPDTDKNVVEFLKQKLREYPFETDPDKPLEYAMEVFTQNPPDLSLDEAKKAVSEINRWWEVMPNGT